jgi:hypothetical protein
MVGFSEVKIHNDIYRIKSRRNRTVLTATRKPGVFTPAYLCLDPDLKHEIIVKNDPVYYPLRYLP